MQPLALLAALVWLAQGETPAPASPPVLPAPDVARIEEAYLELGKLVEKDPSRWDAFFERGVLKCHQIVLTMRQLVDTMNIVRARGAVDAQLEEMRQVGAEIRDHQLQLAYRDFRLMEETLARLGRSDPDRSLFASACLKFAKGEYLKTEEGGPGAVEDFKRLLPRRFEPDHCRRQIYLCYLELGNASFETGDYPKAQSHWGEALRWAPDARLKDLVRSNMAAAFEMDNEFGSAEDLLRKQIAESPDDAQHWKNLGLVLGYQGRLREALVAYGNARDLCKRAASGHFPAVMHGNAWLRSAQIHGKLLEEDGDLLESWRLFLEYREMLGDDYNFSLAFGDVAFHLGAYEVAQVFLERARDLQPHCPNPHILLVQVAARRQDGRPEERRARLEKATEERNAAQQRYQMRQETPGLRRICGGLHDAADASLVAIHVARIEPDPLKGHGPGSPPAWIVEGAKQRKPFRPYDPALDSPKPASAEGAPAAGGGARAARGVAWILVGPAAALALLAAGYFLLRRRAG